MQPVLGRVRGTSPLRRVMAVVVVGALALVSLILFVNELHTSSGTAGEWGLAAAAASGVFLALGWVPLRRLGEPKRPK
jgi:hypothetical protein